MTEIGDCVLVIEDKIKSQSSIGVYCQGLMIFLINLVS